MTRRKETGRTLFLSIISLVLSMSMLVGTTMAWFTDTVNSGMNQILAGNLDIDLEYSKDMAENSWKDVNGAEDLFDPAALWEPGFTQVVYLKMSNEGTLALKYQFGINFKDEVIGKTEDGKDIILSEHLKYAVVSVDEAFASRDAARDAVEDKAVALGNYADDDVMEADEADKLFALVVFMPESVGNEANYRGTDIPKIIMGVNLYATQLNAEGEVDSFGPDYDKDAWVDGFDVYTEQDLNAALANGETAIDVMDNIEVTAPIVVSALGTNTYALRNNAITINLNGNTITGAGLDADGKKAHIIVNNGNLVLKNGTVSSTGENGGSAIYNKGSLTLQDVAVNGAPSNTATGTASYAVNTDGAGSNLTVVNSNISGRGAIGATNGTKVVINGGTYYTPAVAWGHAVYADGQGTEVVINDGTFSEGYEMSANNWGMYQIYSGNYAKVIVNGGHFLPWDCANGYDLATASSGEIVIYGGTFAEDPSNQNKLNYVAADYKVVENNGKFVVVSNSVDSVVSTPAELTQELTDAAAAGAGDSTIVLLGKIDMTGTTWSPINVDGYNGAGVITIEGNGATIKGLTAPLFAGGFAGKSGIVIKDLTIADSNIVSTSGLGGGAFVDTADSMQVVTLENCHLVNSTVSGERTGGLIGWCSGYAKLNDGPVKTYVTISNCSVVDSKVIGAGSAGAIAGHPGASDYTYTTIKNCVVKNVDVVSNDKGSWRTGAIVGTANNGHIEINNVSVKNVTLTQNGEVATETMLYGRFVPSGTGTLVIDGVSVLANATSEGLSDAIASGNANLYLPAGTYKMPSSGATGNITISGTKETVLDMTMGAYMESKNVTIEGVTIKTSTGMANGNGADYAALYTPDVTYKNCTFVGPMRVGRDGAKFINCTFTALGNDYVWTYGNDVTFENCTFNTAGKAILVYSDGGNEVAKVTVKNCTFNSTQGAKAGAIANQNCAAIEIHNYGNGVDLTTAGNTYDSNFSGEWRLKTYESGRPQVIVNGTEYTQIALDGKLMTIDANKEVTVNG